MFDVMTVIPGKKKRSSSGWTSFNCPACHHKGHNPDKRGRGGIKFEGNSNWRYHCFNCHFTCKFQLGKPFDKYLNNFLTWCGVDEAIIKKWSFESLKFKTILDHIEPEKRNLPSAPTIIIPEALPKGAEPLDPNNPKHREYVAEIKRRNVDQSKYEFYIETSTRRLVIPYYNDGEIVGYSYYNKALVKSKYHHRKPMGYVFNSDKQQKEWQICILTEGVFDAISIDGCALLTNTINDEQARELYKLNKRIVFVPDQDEAGLEIIDRMLEYGYMVSLPLWEDDIKDVNDAVVRYGKFPTFLSILQNMTMSKTVLAMKMMKIRSKITRNNNKKKENNA